MGSLAPIDTARAGPGLPAIVVLAGRSMEPRLRRGFRLRVVPIEGPPEPGAIVVLRSAGGSARSRAALLVHRVVATAESGGERLVFHRGDAGGRLGIAAAGSVVGRIVAVLDPPRRCVPALGDLDAGERRAFARAQRRCRAYLRLRAWGRRLAGPGRRWPAPLTAFARGLLLWT